MRRFLIWLILGMIGTAGWGIQSVQAQTPTPPAEVEIIGTARFTAQVNRQDGQPLPAGLEVVLEAYDMDAGLVWSARVPVPADGKVVFEEVPLSEGRVFAGFAVYDGMDFLAEQGPIGMQEDTVQPGDEVALTFILYDASTDAEVLECTRMHIILEPVSAGKTQVSLWYVINNPTGRVVVSDNGKPVTTFAVPQGATNLRFMETTDTSTLIPTEDGFGDTTSVQPGSNYQMFYMLEMNTQREVEFILPLHMPVGQAIIMLPADSLEISGEGLVDNGERTMTDGSNLRVFTTQPLADESVLRFRFGEPQGVSTILIGGVVLGAALLGAGGWWLAAGRKKRQPAVSQPSESLEEVLDSIVALDELHQEGRISAAAYQQRRAELKERARQMKEAHG